VHEILAHQLTGDPMVGVVLELVLETGVPAARFPSALQSHRSTGLLNITSLR
jgi:hypothetical protein